MFAYDDIVRSQCRRLMPIAQRSRMLDRDDLMSIGRMAVIEAISQCELFDCCTSVRAFIRRRVRHRLIDAIRASRACLRQGRGVDHLVPYARFLVDVGDEWRLPRSESNADDLVDSAQRARLVLAAIDRLPTQQGRVVRRMIDGTSPCEVARDLGISKSRVRGLLVAAAKNISRISGIDLHV